MDEVHNFNYDKLIGGMRNHAEREAKAGNFVPTLLLHSHEQIKASGMVWRCWKSFSACKDILGSDLRHKERNFLHPILISDEALPITIRKFLLQPIIGGDAAGKFAPIECFAWGQELSIARPGNKEGLSKKARHNLMAQYLAKLGSRATGCSAFFEKSDDMRQFRFMTPSSTKFHEADFVLNEYENGRPLLADFTICKHIERSGASLKVVPKPLEKAAKTKRLEEPWKDYTRANGHNGIFKALVMNWYGGIGPEFNSLLLEFAESELERSFGFTKLQLRLEPSLRGQFTKARRRRYLAQLQCFYLDLSGRALSAYRSGELAVRGPSRYRAESEFSPNFWPKDGVDPKSISLPSLLGGFNAFDVATVRGDAISVGIMHGYAARDVFASAPFVCV